MTRPRATVTFRLGRAADIGLLVGIPGITPLVLRGERFTC
jgi:hypothetical protein